MRASSVVIVSVVATLFAGCAASKSGASAPSETPSQQAYAQGAASPGAAGYAPQQAPPPPPPAPSPEGATPPGAAKATTPAGGASGATSRSMALQSASSEVESSQRELDVAGSDCRNACRALGSMDRAAGRLCELSQGPDEGRRCDDAKRRVYSARDRVKTTCGSCPNGPSVERAAPIPSPDSSR